MKRQGWGGYPGIFVRLVKQHGIDKAVEAYGRVHDSAGVQNPGAYWMAVMDGRVRLDSGKPEAREEAIPTRAVNVGALFTNVSSGGSDYVPGVEETLAMLNRTRTPERVSSDKPLISAHAQRMIDMGMDPEQAKKLFPPE
jgi:hypothetical protein